MPDEQGVTASAGGVRRAEGRPSRAESGSFIAAFVVAVAAAYALAAQESFLGTTQFQASLVALAIAVIVFDVAVLSRRMMREVRRATSVRGLLAMSLTGVLYGALVGLALCVINA